MVVVRGILVVGAWFEVVVVRGTLVGAWCEASVIIVGGVEVVEAC